MDNLSCWIIFSNGSLKYVHIPNSSVHNDIKKCYIINKDKHTNGHPDTKWWCLRIFMQYDNFWQCMFEVAYGTFIKTHMNSLWFVSKYLITLLIPLLFFLISSFIIVKIF